MSRRRAAGKGTLVYGERAGKAASFTDVRARYSWMRTARSNRRALRTAICIRRACRPRIAHRHHPAGSTHAHRRLDLRDRHHQPAADDARRDFLLPRMAGQQAHRLSRRVGSPGRFLVQPWDFERGLDAVLRAAGNECGGSPAWNLALGPGGKALAIMRSRTGAAAGNHQDIGVISPDGGEGPLVTTKANEVSPRVSPNGKWLAYASNESGTYQVYVVPLPGPGARVPVSVQHGIEPMWSRDGKTLFYVSHDLMLGATSTKRAVDFSRQEAPRHPVFVRRERLRRSESAGARSDAGILRRVSQRRFRRACRRVVGG